MQPRFLLRLIGWLCCLVPLGAQAQSAQGCLASTGYAFEDNSSLAWLFADRNTFSRDHLFPARPGAPLTGDSRAISCAPPQRTADGTVLPAEREVTATAGATTTSLLVGTGISAATAALVTPGQFHRSTSEIDVELSFRLSVVADDVTFTGDVPLSVKIRYAFGAVTGSASGTGKFAIGTEIDYVLQAAGARSFRQAWDGPPGDITGVGNSSFDVERVINVPANYSDPVTFEARFALTSDAQGGPRGIGTRVFGDAKAQASVNTTFEFGVPEGFSVEFPMVAELGLAPPKLGVVTPPPPPRPAPDQGSTAAVLSGAILPMLLED